MFQIRNRTAFSEALLTYLSELLLGFKDFVPDSEQCGFQYDSSNDNGKAGGYTAKIGLMF
jgi:hypothetical protein